MSNDNPPYDDSTPDWGETGYQRPDLVSNDNRNELAAIIHSKRVTGTSGSESEAYDFIIADAVLAAGYHTTPNNDDGNHAFLLTVEEPSDDDLRNAFIKHRSDQPDEERLRTVWRLHRTAPVLPYPENKEHTP